MNTVLRISEAGAIAFHTMVHLAQDPSESFSTHEIAEALDVSEAHLSKVLQRLNKAGLVNSQRGPNGGYRLAAEPTELKLIDIYEAIEGKFNPNECMLGFPVCKRDACIMGDFLHKMNHQFSEYLSENTLEDISTRSGGHLNACEA